VTDKRKIFAALLRLGFNASLVKKVVGRRGAPEEP